MTVRKAIDYRFTPRYCTPSLRYLQENASLMLYLKFNMVNKWVTVQCYWNNQEMKLNINFKKAKNGNNSSQTL